MADTSMAVYFGTCRTSSSGLRTMDCYCDKCVAMQNVKIRPEVKKKMWAQMHALADAAIERELERRRLQN